MTGLTRQVRDRAVAALRRAHTEGRHIGIGQPWGAFHNDDRVCSCVIIGEEFGLPEAVFPGDVRLTGIDARKAAIEALYAAIDRLGLPTGAVYIANDVGGSFDLVAARVARFEVVEEAERICRDAAAVAA